MNKKNAPIIVLVITLIILNIIVLSNNRVLGVVSSLLSLFALSLLRSNDAAKKEKHEKEIEQLDKYFDDITRSAIFSLPFPTTIVRENGKIIWCNTKFKELFSSKDLKSSHIGALISDLSIENIKDDKNGYIDSQINNRYYSFYYTRVDTYDQEDEDIILIYGFDRTDFVKVKESKEDDRLIVMVLEIDNYDEVKANTDESIRPVVLGQIDTIVNTFATDYNGFARKYENDKYLLIFDKLNFERMKEDRFPIVENLENLDDKTSVSATMSAGVGSNDDSPLEVYKTARLALDVAKGRGGNQIVENNGDNLEYYGGKKGAVDKRTKVKSRIISNAIVQLIDQLADVYIMGHKNPDMDSFGSCLGMYALVKSRGAKAKIVLKEVSPQISSLYSQAIESVEGLKEDIISVEKAYDSASENSLIVLLDNHSKDSAEAPGLLDISENLVLIDHHRRGENYVESPTLAYLEPYASSASELVTEIIQYTDGVDLDKTIAEGLLAGIKVDTKSFTFQTGVRTFEAASFLQKEGADAIRVNALFDEPAETVKDVAEVVAATEIFESITAISTHEDQADNSVLVAAKAADQMLNMKSVKASFVLTQLEDSIHISGRSTGAISVQIICERLGGGGHQTAAATQIRDVDIEEAKKRLKKEIKIYLEEEE